jgi:hypothetical protein
MQQFEVCVVRDDRQVAVPCCCVYNFSTRARYSRGGSHNVNTGWPSLKLFLILFFPLKLELFTFQICNFLKVNIFKNETKIV